MPVRIPGGRDSPVLNVAAQSPASDRPWLKSLAGLAGLLLLHFLAFHASYQSLFGLWMGSENYAHAVLVPPICLWLAWRQRAVLATVTPRPALAIVPLVLGIGFTWLLGHLGAVNTVVHFCLIATIVAMTVALLGAQVARVLAFPLGFLFFAVPFGEFLFPVMMDATADFVVAALQLTGIPVYREGLQFVIPTGNWSVVEACSGLRYLIASMMVGTLFAYLNYRGLRRRLLFVFAAFVVPVVANWVRAYMIAMIGHLSNNKYAVDVDHLIYGWVFFGAVMFAMFLVGSRFADTGPEDLLVKVPPAKPAGEPTPARFLWVLGATALAVVLPALLASELDDPRHTQPPVLAIGTVAPSWQAASQPEPTWQPDLTPPSAVVHEAFSSASAGVVGAYVGYYRNQSDRSKLVSSQNHLVKSSHPVWAVVRSAPKRVELFTGAVVSVDEVEVRALQQPYRMIVWQTYWVDGHWTSSPMRAKLYTLWQRLKGQGDDGATLIVYAGTSKPGDAQAALSSFVRENLPHIESQLRRAHGNIQP